MTPRGPLRGQKIGCATRYRPNDLQDGKRAAQFRFTINSDDAVSTIRAPHVPENLPETIPYNGRQHTGGTKGADSVQI